MSGPQSGRPGRRHLRRSIWSDRPRLSPARRRAKAATRHGSYSRTCRSCCNSTAAKPCNTSRKNSDGAATDGRIESSMPERSVSPSADGASWSSRPGPKTPDPSSSVKTLASHELGRRTAELVASTGPRETPDSGGPWMPLRRSKVVPVSASRLHRRSGCLTDRSSRQTSGMPKGSRVSRPTGPEQRKPPARDPDTDGGSSATLSACQWPPGWAGVWLIPSVKVHSVAEQPLDPARPWPTAAWGEGDRAFALEISEWPIRKRRKRLASFLRYEPKPLSARATAGFTSRLQRSSLKRSAAFERDLLLHLHTVSGPRDQELASQAWRG